MFHAYIYICMFSNLIVCTDMNLFEIIQPSMMHTQSLIFILKSPNNAKLD